MAFDVLYPFCVTQFETTDGKEWYIEFPDVPGVAGGVSEAENKINTHLCYLREEGLPVPAPSVASNKNTAERSYFECPKARTGDWNSQLNRKESVSIHFLMKPCLKSWNAMNAWQCFKRQLNTWHYHQLNKETPIHNDHSGLQTIKTVQNFTQFNTVFQSLHISCDPASSLRVSHDYSSSNSIFACFCTTFSSIFNRFAGRLYFECRLNLNSTSFRTLFLLSCVRNCFAVSIKSS